MKPTKIIKPPQLATGRRCDGLMITCDNGECYSVKQLAGIIGVSSSTLGNRIKTRGWDDEHIMAYRLPKKKDKPEFDSELGRDRIDMSNLEHLSGRVRTENLRKIKDLGSWEKRR